MTARDDYAYTYAMGDLTFRDAPRNIPGDGDHLFHYYLDELDGYAFMDDPHNPDRDVHVQIPNTDSLGIVRDILASPQKASRLEGALLERLQKQNLFGEKDTIEVKGIIINCLTNIVSRGAHGSTSIRHK